jgi:hypothetical protein
MTDFADRKMPSLPRKPVAYGPLAPLLARHIVEIYK